MRVRHYSQPASERHFCPRLYKSGCGAGYRLVSYNAVVIWLSIKYLYIALIQNYTDKLPYWYKLLIFCRTNNGWKVSSSTFIHSNKHLQSEEHFWQPLGLANIQISMICFYFHYVFNLILILDCKIRIKNGPVQFCLK